MYHKPVLLHESIALLDIHPDGTYVDATFGGGGHSREILNKLDKGRLFAFDQDEDAGRNILPDERFNLIPQNFRYMKNFLKILGITTVDGILADLGISSWQIDRKERGFSTRSEGELDMRMDPNQERTASYVIHEYSEKELSDILYHYGEIGNARQLARKIVQAREEQSIRTTTQLASLAAGLAPRGKENQYLAQVFQAIRIEVNEELEALKELLVQSVDMLAPGRRIVIIAYHSLEDRLVKNFFQAGNFTGEKEKDFYGNSLSPLEPVIRKVVRPSAEEMQENPRSRSARLRAAEKKNHGER